jgi:hypothetical protein
MHIWPFHATRNMTGHTMLGAVGHDGRPLALALQGTLTDGGEMAVVAFEQPERWDKELTADKQRRERLHVDRFLRDFERGTNTTYSDECEVGDDPPDFVCSAGETTWGLECTQWLIGDRVRAAAEFDRIIGLIHELDQNAIRHLRGFMVYVMFSGQTKALGSRPPRTQSTDAQSFLTVLQAYRPDPPVFDGLPESLQGTGIVTRFDGGALSAVPLAVGHESPLATRWGFDVSLAFQSDVIYDDEWQRFAEAVARKDVSGSTTLLVSAGAPVQGGYSFPSDALAAQAALEGARTSALQTTELREIFVHFWEAESIVRITPGQAGVELVCGELPFQEQH